MTAKKKPVEKLSTADDKAPDLDTKGTEAKAAELSTADDKAPDLDTKAAEYRVAEGLSITTKRGTLSAGVMIEPRDLPGGQASIDALLKSKKIKKL